MTKRRLKPIFRTNIFIIGTSIILILWTSILINIFIFNSNATIGWINAVMGLMVMSFFIGAIVQLSDCAKEYNKLINKCADITMKIIIKMDKHYKNKLLK